MDPVGNKFSDFYGLSNDSGFLYVLQCLRIAVISPESKYNTIQYRPTNTDLSRL